MAIRTEVLNRIVIGKNLLSTAGLLNPNAAPLTVAQSVLLAHDASEVVLAALADHIGIVIKDDKGKGKQKTYLMDYVDAIQNQKSTLSLKSFFNQLNNARVSFKHHGILPTSQQFYDCIPETRKKLDEACLVCIGQLLDELGLQELIEDESTRQFYKDAMTLCHEEKWEDALKSLAECFAAALISTPFQFHVTVGKPSTEGALYLLGYGVDPSMFLSLQGFLPTLHIIGGEMSWNLRKMGHPGNWNFANVNYCLESLLTIILQIQHASFHPRPIPFEYVYEDVLTANCDGVEILAEKLSLIPLDLAQPAQRNTFGTLQKGQKIWGHLIPVFLAECTSTWEEVSFEAANFLVMRTPKTDIPGEIEHHVDFLVRANQVDLTYRVIDDEWVRERCPHLFERSVNSP